MFARSRAAISALTLALLTAACSLRDADRFSSGAPPPVDAGNGCVLEIAGYDEHACAVRSDHTLWCWGRNDSGQLGDGSVDGGSVNLGEPVQVEDLQSSVSRVTVGGEHTCALKNDGTLWCWGNGERGQLGTGELVSWSIPIKVLDDVRDVSAGAQHTCAVLGDGTVRCWGANDAFQCGTADADCPVPTPVSGIADAAEVAVGEKSSCVRSNDGKIACWGRDTQGQLGDGATDSGGPTPVAVADIFGAQSLSVGSEHACARGADGTLWCWGQNLLGAVGTASPMEPSPVAVPVDGSSTVDAVAAGGTHTCSIVGQSVWCWGLNSYGQLGDGSAPATGLDPKPPVRVADVEPSVQRVHAGKLHSCAWAPDGAAYCWGANSAGQLGLGTTSPRELKAAKVVLPCPQ